MVLSGEQKMKEQGQTYDFGEKLCDWYQIEQIPWLVRFDGGGEHYDFDDTQTFNWNFKWMLHNLRDEDIATVADGPAGNSGGIVSCKLVRTQHYDHKREHAEKHSKSNWTRIAGEVHYYIWDFFVDRADGSTCWLHPEANGDVQYGEAEVQEIPIQAPWGVGPGGSWGPGTYKYFRDFRTKTKLKFARNKCEIQTPHVITR